MYLKFQIKLPVFLETIILYFLLRHRKKHHGFPFRKIKLIRADRKAKPVYAKVDPEDYLKLSQCDWQLIENKSKNSYAVRYDDEGKYIKMHRIIMNAPKGSIVDHIDHDGLNNIKQNLRFAMGLGINAL